MIGLTASLHGATEKAYITRYFSDMALFNNLLDYPIPSV